MYSGLTLTKYSGCILGTHQKFDKLVRSNLSKLDIDDSAFPSIKQILHFEGNNGPDAIKRKSPSVDEPWHYFDPFDVLDVQLLDLIDDHFVHLVKALKIKNTERASFESAWLAHALTDGLTPAHHFPYEKELTKLRDGKSMETRTTIKEKWVIPGDSKKDLVVNNWKMWGAKGLIVTHGMFEMGIASIITPLSLKGVLPSKDKLADAMQKGLRQCFIETAREVAVLDLYKQFYIKGWTPKLALDVRHKLAPAIIKTITIAWYLALVMSHET